MMEEDFDFSVRITDTMNWKLVKEDFAFMTKLEPEGCFVLLHDKERIGIVTTINFGKVSWLGNLIVDEDHRKTGAGTMLAKEAIRYLTSRKAETVGLYSYLNAITFYKKLKFQYDSEFIVLRGKAKPSRFSTSCRKAEKEEFHEIIDFDKAFFGTSREKLLKQILENDGTSCHVHAEDGRIQGYAVAKPYGSAAELGPLVCLPNRSKVAVSLLKAVLGDLTDLEVYLTIQGKRSAIIKTLSDYGFREYFRVARMFLNPITINDCIYVAESLERG
jgi:hypothetical protein